MAKITTRKFRKENAVGDVVEFESSITVDSEGVFFIPVIDDVCRFIEPASRCKEAKRLRYSVGSGFNQRRKTGWQHGATGKNLDHCIKVVAWACKLFIACETTEELVLIYAHDSDVSFATSGQGDIYPNCYYGENLEWRQFAGDRLSRNSMFGDNGFYRVGLFARIVNKITHTREQGVSVEYARPDFPNPHSEPDTWGEKLNDFVKLDGPNKDDRIVEIPYTEESAEFFYTALISLCQLADRIDNLFGDPGNVTLAIESRQQLLPAPGTKP